VPKKPISEQVVLVTGASSGLGRAIARLAGKRGAKVVVTARNAQALDTCVGEIEQSARVEEQKAGTGVAISLVLPGAINTPQFDRARQKLGYQPEPIPPIYQPEPFAEATLHCAEHPVRELPISWGAQRLLWGQKLSPRAGDWVLRRKGWKAQHTAEPKPLDAPDNLFDTLPGDPGAHGRFDRQARGSTLWTRLRLLLPKG
jgi:short-subunit dehydrogenase